MIRSTSVLLSVTVALLLGGCSTYTVLPHIRGVVVSQDGAYVAGAKVRLLYGKTLFHHQIGLTDEIGHFALEKVAAPTPPGGFMRVTFPPGTGKISMLEVRADGFETASFVFEEETSIFLPSNRSIEETIRRGTSSWAVELHYSVTPAAAPNDIGSSRSTCIPIRLQTCGRSLWIAPVVISKNSVE